MSARIVIVEDQPWCRTYLREVCTRKLKLEVVGETANGTEAIALINQLVPDIALIDLHLEGDNGFVVAEKVAATLPAVRLVFMSVSCLPLTVARIARTPVHGFIDKNFREPQAFVWAMQEVMGGRKFFSPSYWVEIRRQKLDPNAADKVLTRCELQVVRLVGQCWSDGEIAAKIGSNPKTVQTHRLVATRKLGLETRESLIAYAIRQGFTEFPEQAEEIVDLGGGAYLFQ